MSKITVVLSKSLTTYALPFQLAASLPYAAMKSLMAASTAGENDVPERYVAGVEADCCDGEELLWGAGAEQLHTRIEHARANSVASSLRVNALIGASLALVLPVLEWAA